MRLIDADEAKRKAIICTNAVIAGDEDEAITTFVNALQNLLILAFDEAPTIDAEPVRHGRWIQVDETKCKCTNCDSIVLIAIYPHGDKNYCPNCGAKMDKEETT